MKHLLKVGVVFFLVKVFSILKDIYLIKELGNSELFNSFQFNYEIIIACCGLLISPISSLYVPNLSLGNYKAIWRTNFSCLFTSTITMAVLYFFLTTNFFEIKILLFLLAIPLFIFRSILESILLFQNRQIHLVSTQCIAPIAFISLHKWGFSLESSFILSLLSEIMITTIINYKSLLKETSVLKLNNEIEFDFFYLTLASIAGFFLIIVDQSMLKYLASQSVVLFSYGTKLSLFISTAGVVIVGYIILPKLAEDYKNLNFKKFKKKTFFLVLVTITLSFSGYLLIIFSDELIKALFYSKSISLNDLSMIIRVNDLYFLQIPFVITSTLLVKFFNVIKRNNIFWKIGSSMVILNIILNLILFKYFNIAGIALSTTLVQLYSFSILLFVFLTTDERFAHGTEHSR